MTKHSSLPQIFMHGLIQFLNLRPIQMFEKTVFFVFWWNFKSEFLQEACVYNQRKASHHRHLSNIDCLSFVVCPLLAPVLIVNRLLFFFFFFFCGHLQNYWSKQDRQYVPLSSLYYLDVYASHYNKRLVDTMRCGF